MRKDKLVEKQTGGASETVPGRPSPLEMIKLHGGRAHRVKGMAGREADSMIAVYNDRFTYTFIMNKEVASIHFDSKNNKIYFSGHNIQNMSLSEDQRVELFNLVNTLEEDPEGKNLKEAYSATLSSQIADNK